jgi:hypothetical protein
MELPLFEYSTMSHWVLNCPECHNDFTHSDIEDAKLEDYLFPGKPEFPVGGLRLECPYCHKTSLFQRHQLTYRAY